MNIKSVNRVYDKTLKHSKGSFKYVKITRISQKMFSKF